MSDMLAEKSVTWLPATPDFYDHFHIDPQTGAFLDVHEWRTASDEARDRAKFAALVAEHFGHLVATA
jgi:hypothetical protein